MCYLSAGLATRARIVGMFFVELNASLNADHTTIRLCNMIARLIGQKGVHTDSTNNNDFYQYRTRNTPDGCTTQTERTPHTYHVHVYDTHT